jgi:hypothetical protein
VPLENADDRQLVEEVARAERDAIAKVIDPPVVRRAQAPDDAKHLVALVQ